jgi:hypothetical protein
VLRKRLQVGDVEGEFLFDQAVDRDLVGSGVEVRNGAMVSIVSTLFGDEA